MDIWYADINAVSPDRIIYDVLSPDEISVGKRFQTQHLRDHYYCAKYITRLLAGKYLNEPAGSIEILKTAEGKPYLGDGNVLHFNVSHSRNMFVLAFSDSPVGIDIEFARELPDLNSIASHICSENEYIYFNQLSTQDQHRYFFKLWSAKESFLKLTGSGLLREPKDIVIDNHKDLLGKGVVNMQHEGIIAYCTPLDFSVVDFHCFVCSQNPDNQWRLFDVVQENIL